MMKKLPKHPVDVHVGKKVRDQRIYAGLTQVALANRVSIGCHASQREPEERCVLMNAISTFPTRKAPASLTLLRAAPVATRGRRSGLANARPSPQSQPNEAGHRVDVG